MTYSLVMSGAGSVFESHKTREQLEKLITTLDKSTFDVAELLYTVKANKYFQEWGFDSFKSYITTLSLKSAKAQYLCRIVKIMKAVNIPRAAYEPVGVAKLREICQLDPEGFYFNPETSQNEPLSGYIAGLVAKGKEMTIQEIQEHVSVLKGLVGEDELVFVNFKVKKSVKEIIMKAIGLAKLNIGTVGQDDEGFAINASDSKAMEIIAQSYIDDPNNSPEFMKQE